MNEQELLLSDEFVEFSQTIAECHKKKKALEEEFKKFFDVYKAKKTELEDAVATASSKWEAWKKEQSSEKSSKGK
jgi:hypothetical protein